MIAARVDEPCILGPRSSCGPCGLFDVPLSLAADTVRLPATAMIAVTREAADEPGKKER